MTTYTDIILQDTNGNFFVPYGFIERLGDVQITNPTQGQNLTYDAVNQVWKNTSTTATVAWGGITGTLSDQTDLQNALDSKLTSSDLANYVTTNTQQTITAQKTFNTRVNFLGTGDANAIYLSTDTRIDVNGTSYTVLGFASGTFLINNAAYNLMLRGKQTRPVYNSNSNPIALLSDVPTDTGDLTNNAGYIKGITSSDVTTALGYTPYSSANPNNYTSVVESTVSGWGFTKNVGTVTSVNNISPVNGNVTIPIPAAQVNSDWNATSGKAEILNKPNLATVATSGSYNDLLNKPTIPDTSNLANKDLSNLTTTGNAKFQAPITGGASTITSSDLTANRALISNSSGKVAVSAVTSSQLGYLSTVTSNVQSQLDGKQPSLVSGTNIKTINSTSLLGGGNIDTSEIFIATYGVTTFRDVLDAFQDDKEILVKDVDIRNTMGNIFYAKLCVMQILDTPVAFWFSYIEGNSIKRYLLEADNSWSVVNLTAETTNNKVTSISSSSTDTQYPSAKCVYDELDGKVSKSGDTMTGDLNISKTNPQFHLINTDMELGVTPSENYVSSLRFIDKNETNLGSCYLRQQSTGVTDINLNCINPSGGSAATLRVGFNANGNAYSTFPNTYRCDGQWIAESQTICSGRTAETSDKNWTLNLPNDSYDYEVLLVGAVTTGATSGNQARINLQSSIIQSNIVICNAQTRTTSTVTTYGACIIPVGSNHTVTVIGWGSNTGAYSLYLRGYRRIGTNE